MADGHNSTRLAAAMAIILGTGAAADATEADAQSRLDVYSDNWQGGSSPAPAGATRDTTINMRIPRLQALVRELNAIQTDLDNHSIPTHGHPAHSHPPPPPPPGDQDADQDVDQDVGDQDTGDQDTGDQDTGDQDTGDQDTGDQDTAGDSPSPGGPLDGFDPGMSSPGTCASPGW